MKIDSIPEILSISDLDPINDKILVEQNGKTFYTTLFDIQTILNTRDRPSEKTSWRFLEKNNVVQSPISKISQEQNKVTFGEEEAFSLTNPLEIKSAANNYLSAKIADLGPTVPSGVRRVIVKLVAENLTINIKWRASSDFSLDIGDGEKHVSIFPMENIQNCIIDNLHTDQMYNSSANFHKARNSLLREVPGIADKISIKIPFPLNLEGSFLASSSSMSSSWYNNYMYRNHDENRDQELGPIAFKGYIPTNSSSQNLDPVDRVSMSVNPLIPNKPGKIYSFQVIAYSNFG